MTVRLLGPAHPVRRGRLATVSASLRASTPQGGTAVWDWDDGSREVSTLVLPTARRASWTHRYAEAGVYRVMLRLALVSDEALVRYVAVARPDQAAGSGWVSDLGQQRPIPFGFLLTPGRDGAPGALALRCWLAAGEMRSTDLSWTLVGGDGSLHFGGRAVIDARPGMHSFRVDIGPPDRPRQRSGQRLEISLYAPRDVPGRDSPIERVAGTVRPGRVDLGPLADEGGPR